MKITTTLLVIVLAALVIGCTPDSAEDSTAIPIPINLKDFDALNQWYSSDIVVENIRKSYQSIDRQPPQVGHFAQACTLSRKVGFAEMISNEELRNRTRGEEYSTPYNINIA